MLRCYNVAQLRLLKLELEVTPQLHTHASYFSLLFQENKIDRNEFAVKSEKVWSSMEEMERERVKEKENELQQQDEVEMTTVWSSL